MPIRHLFWIFVAVTVFGCRESEHAPQSATFATTIYPFRAILEPVVGSKGAVRNMLPAGASPHTYDPRPSDVRTAFKARALFYGAPELDRWAAGLGSGRGIALIDLLPDSLVLELPEMQHGGGHGHAPGRDPHFWMDPLAVDALIPPLVDTLCSLDTAACSEYRRNGALFSRHLQALDDSVRSIVEPVTGSHVLVSHPFIQYFTQRYGVRLAGVIEEIPGAEPTSRDMQRIVRSVQSAGADAIITLPQLPDRAARAISETVGIPVLELDPIGGYDDRMTYEELILYNARTLRDGLGRVTR